MASPTCASSCCDGLKGLPDAITATWPQAIVQTCVLHLIRNTFRFAGRQDWDAIAKDLRPIYTAPTEPTPPVTGSTSSPRPGASSIRRSSACGRTAWAEFVPFLAYELEIRRVIYSDQRHREPQRPVPTGGPSTRALPQRAGRTQVPLPGDPIPRPDRSRQATLGGALEARTQRLRPHVRRPNIPQPAITAKLNQSRRARISYTEIPTVPHRLRGEVISTTWPMLSGECPRGWRS